jgi:hypothetical protein
MNRPSVSRSIALMALTVLTIGLAGCAELLSTLPEGGSEDRSTPQDGLREALARTPYPLRKYFGGGTQGKTP